MLGEERCNSWSLLNGTSASTPPKWEKELRNMYCRWWNSPWIPINFPIRTIDSAEARNREEPRIAGVDSCAHTLDTISRHNHFDSSSVHCLWFGSCCHVPFFRSPRSYILHLDRTMLFVFQSLAYGHPVCITCDYIQMDVHWQFQSWRVFKS